MAACIDCAACFVFGFLWENVSDSPKITYEKDTVYSKYENRVEFFHVDVQVGSTFFLKK